MLPTAFCCLHGGWACDGVDIFYRPSDAGANGGAGSMDGAGGGASGAALGRPPRIRRTGSLRSSSAFSKPSSRRASVSGDGPPSAVPSPSGSSVDVGFGDWEVVAAPYNGAGVGSGSGAGAGAAGLGSNGGAKLGDSTAAALFVTEAGVFRSRFPALPPGCVHRPTTHSLTVADDACVEDRAGAAGDVGSGGGASSLAVPPPPRALERLDSEESPRPSDATPPAVPPAVDVDAAMVQSRGKSPPASPRESMEDGGCVGWWFAQPLCLGGFVCPGPSPPHPRVATSHTCTPAQYPPPRSLMGAPALACSAVVFQWR